MCNRGNHGTSITLLDRLSESDWHYQSPPRSDRTPGRAGKFNCKLNRTRRAERSITRTNTTPTAVKSCDEVSMGEIPGVIRSGLNDCGLKDDR